MQKLYEIQISVLINKILLEHSQYSFIYILTGAAFMLQQQSWIVAVETVQPPKCKNIHYLDLYGKKFVNSWYWSVSLININVKNLNSNFSKLNQARN